MSDRLYFRNPKEWEFWLNGCCVDQDGERYGWGRVLDYIGVPWRDPEHWYLNPNGDEFPNQMTIFDYL